MTEYPPSLLHLLLGVLIGASFWVQSVLQLAYRLPPFHTKRVFIWGGLLLRLLACGLTLGVLFTWASHYGQNGQSWFGAVACLFGAAAAYLVLRPKLSTCAAALRPRLLPTSGTRSAA